MRRTMILALLLGATPLCAQTPEPEPVTRFDGEVVVRVTLRDAQDLMLIGQLSDDPWSHAPGVGADSDWRMSRERLATLRAAGVPFKVLIADVQAVVQAERERLAQPRKSLDWFADFKDLAAINARLDALVAARPDLCSIVNLPVTSIQGRTISTCSEHRHLCWLHSACLASPSLHRLGF